MSNLYNDAVVEALADEFFDDVKYAIEWLERQGFDKDDLFEMSEEELCDLYIDISMDLRG